MNPSLIDEPRHSEANRVTWVSVIVNLFLTIMQIGAGLLTHAQGLVADGFHSLSDLVADFLVLLANRHSKHPADSAHPYGHHRIETVASLALGLILLGTGAGILWAATTRLQHLDDLPAISSTALWIAFISLGVKEGLFRYMLRIGEKLRSPMLIANAWHARADAASSLVVAAGIGGSLMGWRILDPIAAVIVGFMIMRMGWQFSWEALNELIDTGLTQKEVADIRATMTSTPGVLGAHEIRTRRMAHQVLVDVHIDVAAHISVSEGHQIAEITRKRVLDAHPDVLDVLVHIDIAGETETINLTLPDRQTVLNQLNAALGQPILKSDNLTLHYLNNELQVSLVLTPELAQQAHLVTRLRDYGQKNYPHFVLVQHAP